MPALWREAITLRDSSIDQDRTVRFSHPHRQWRLRWVNDLDYESHRLSALFQKDTTEGQIHHFAHLTNWPLAANHVESLARAGRQRWKIENEGFNVLKNGGFDLVAPAT